MPIVIVQTNETEKESVMDDLRLDINSVEYSTELLKKHFPKGATVWLVIRQVSRSGMYRHISCHSVHDSEVSWLSYHVAKVLKWTYKEKTHSVGVGGCGMDMGFHLVYNLASILYDDGYALKQRYI